MVRRSILLVLAVLLGSVVVVPAVGAAVQSVESAQITLHRPVSLGRTEVTHFVTPQSTVTVNASEQAVIVEADGQYRFEFDAGYGSVLEARAYHYDPDEFAEAPRMSILGTHSCGGETGTFEVLDALIFDEDLLRLWVTWDFCGTFGEIRLDMPATPVLDAVPSMVKFPDEDRTDIDISQTTVLVEAQETVDVVAATFVGPDAGEFAITLDGCAGRQLLAGQSCRVDVSADHDLAGPVVAWLAVELADGRAVEVTSLEVSSHPGLTSLVVTSSPGDPVGQGGSWDLDIGNAGFFGRGNSGKLLFAATEDDAGTSFDLTLDPPSGEGFAAGAAWTGAVHPSEPDGRPELLVVVDGRSCNPLDGEMSSASYASSAGALASADVSFTQRCLDEDGNPLPELTGRIRWRVPPTEDETPSPVTDLQATDLGDGLWRLQWSGDSEPGLRHHLVRQTSSGARAQEPDDGFPIDAVTDGQIEVFAAPDRVTTFSVHPIGDNGVVGEAAHVTITPFGPRLDNTRVEHHRLAGTDRYLTAVAVSRQAFPTGGSAGGVVLARGDNFPDALAGAPLAMAVDGPILLTRPTSLPSVTLDEVRRVLPAGGAVHVLGGPNAVNESVLVALRDDGYAVRRLAGKNRAETAVAVAQELGEVGLVLVANGQGHRDAVLASAAAASIGAAVLLTDGASPAPATTAYLEQTGATPLAIGAVAAEAHLDAESIHGRDAIETSAILAEVLFPRPTAVAVARVDDFADALGGSVLAARLGMPLLLTATNELGAAVASWACSTDGSALDLAVHGGPRAVADGVVGRLVSALEGVSC